MTESTIVSINPKYPAFVGVAPISEFAVKSQSFKSYGETVRAARKTPGDFVTELWRAWVLRNVEARDASGAAVPFTLADMLGWPAPYGVKLQELQRTSTGPAGKIVKDGNGLDEAVVYQLGTPLPVGKDGLKITELEFLLRTIGDVEPIMSGEGKFDQAAALIEQCATPLGGDVTLQRLPSFAMDALTLVDGLTILDAVLPRFTESARP